jgi:hypothetical protein
MTDSFHSAEAALVTVMFPCGPVQPQAPILHTRHPTCRAIEPIWEERRGEIASGAAGKVIQNPSGVRVDLRK